MDNPFANGTPSLHGGVGTGALVASSTESGYLDLFIATPAGTTSSNAALTGAYQAADLEFANGNAQTLATPSSPSRRMGPAAWAMSP
jgi:hypothetical protein